MSGAVQFEGTATVLGDDIATASPLFTALRKKMREKDLATTSRTPAPSIAVGPRARARSRSRHSSRRR